MSISLLYLNPLQIRVCKIVAIDPKDKPKDQYPKIAILEDNEIIIKPKLKNENF